MGKPSSKDDTAAQPSINGHRSPQPVPSESVNSVKKRKLTLAGLLLPYWKPFVMGILAVVIEALTDLLQPWPLKIVIDLVGGKPMPARLGVWVTAIFGTDKLAILNFVGISVIAIAGL